MQLQHRKIATTKEIRIHDPNRPRNVFGFSDSPPRTLVVLSDAALPETVPIANPVAWMVSVRDTLQRSLADPNRSIHTLYTLGIELMRSTIAVNVGHISANQLKSHEILRIASSPSYDLIKNPKSWITIHNYSILGISIIQNDEKLFLRDINTLLKKVTHPRTPDLVRPLHQNFIRP